MQETDNKTKKFIFTDSFRTKDILWEAYTGFIDAYHDYKMLLSISRNDPITIATMNKYAYYFYNEIEDFLEDFEINKKDEIIKIFEQETIENEDFTKIRKFFALFMKLSGIKNIVKESDDLTKSVLENR